MTSLFIFFVHGGRLSARVVTKQTIAIESMITFCVFHEDSSNRLIINGSPIIDEYMAHKHQWFRPPKQEDALAEFKQLFDQLMARYQFKREDIFTSFEGNWTKQKLPYLTPIVIESINYVKPGYTFLPSGTPECCKYVNYWIGYRRYPRLDLGETLNLERDYYQEKDLTSGKREELNNIAKDMLLTCDPLPLLATFDKASIGKAIGFLLRFSEHNKSNTEEMDSLPNSIDREAFLSFQRQRGRPDGVTEEEDNQIYLFDPRYDQNVAIPEYTTKNDETYQNTVSHSPESSKISSESPSRESISWRSGENSLRSQNYHSRMEKYGPSSGQALSDQSRAITGDNCLDQMTILQKTQAPLPPLITGTPHQEIRVKPAPRPPHHPARTWLQFFSAYCTCRCFCEDVSNVNSTHFSAK